MAKGSVIGLIGAPGIGKGYITRGLKQIHPDMEFVMKITTRESRITDASEGVRTVSQEEFDILSPALVSIHQPFGENRYGWDAHTVNNGINRGVHYICDPNINFATDFRQAFGKDIYFIGMVANDEYILDNLISRTVLEKGDIAEKEKADISKRLEQNGPLTSAVLEAHSRGIIDDLIHVGYHNRDNLLELVRNMTEARINNNIEGQNRIIETNMQAFSGAERR